MDKDAKREVPAKIKPFTFQGVDLAWNKSSKEAVGECPFCNKEGHFHANIETGQWDCKRCGESGNVASFLLKFWKESIRQTTEDDYAELSEDRGIPARILKAWGLAVSVTNNRWLIPSRMPDEDAKGIPNLSLCDNETLRPFSTAGCKQQLFGFVNKIHKTVWVCEGIWDAMAWDAILRATRKHRTNAVVGLPGAGSGHKLLTDLCEAKDVKIVLDHDKAGRNGTEGVIKTLGDAKGRPKSVEAINWPEDAEVGYDVRDLIRDTQTAKDAFRSVKEMLEPVDLSILTEDEGELRIISYADIEPEEVRWLWKDRIPLGKLTNIQGNPGVGKSYVICDMIARVTKGAGCPDGSTMMQGEVIYFTSEDGAGDTIRPRLDLLGANPKKAHHFDCVEKDGEDLGFDLVRDLGKLDRLLADNPNIRLLVFDPLTAFFGGKVDSHKNADVRRMLGPLKRLMEERNVAIIGINHLNKAEMKAVHRGQGSIAINAQARAVWQVCEDPDDPNRRLFLPVKMNLAKSSGLAFRINNNGLFWDEGSVDMTADEAEANNPNRDDAGRLDEAKEWLQTLLEKEGLPAKEVHSQARKDGLSSRTIIRAKQVLKIRSVRVDGGWLWTYPKTAPASWKQDGQAKLKSVLNKRKSAKKGVKTP